ncbi:MAG: hypothetical protein RLZZ316_3018 [Bacteroidota bacterium]
MKKCKPPHLFFIFTFILPATILAQHQELQDNPILWKGKEQQHTDTAGLLYVFKKGQVHGHFRYFFMHTNNEAALTDYYAHAAGGGIKYETGLYKGWQAGISGFFIFNLASSDLAKPDAATQANNRYEIGLFDITNPHNKTDINRLEELYLKYQQKEFVITAGKQLINTPFINLQDGRMRPTVVDGVWLHLQPAANTNIAAEGGWIYGISPRSTVKWYGVGASIGVYPVGVNENGIKSGYAGNVNTNAVWLVGASYTLTKNTALKACNVFVPKVFNTTLSELSFNFPTVSKSKWVFGLQSVYQTVVNNGGNTNPAKAYYKKGGHAITFGIKAGWQNTHWQTSLNYNRITAAGRYLMPREWGREPFFTFLPRERNEGLGDVHAYTTKINYHFIKQRINSQLGLGYYNLPPVNNYALNKYGLPSYVQLNLDVRYEWAGFFKGVETQLLYVCKKQASPETLNKRAIINKVNMHQWNLIMNFHF